MAESTDRKSSQFYEFGPFRVDPEKELLLREDQTVPIAPKAFQVLLVLIRHSKEVVTKDDLLKTIWPDTFVEEANLSRNIFLLRKALGESPQDRQYIVTVPGRGYRFVEDVQLIPEPELDVVAATHSKVEIQIKETRPWGRIGLAAVLVLAVAAGAWKFVESRKPLLTEQDTVVLADFANTTGDPVFDGTLRQGLAIQLEQSPFLKIMDDDQVQHNLSLMNVPPGTQITNRMAHDVCAREGAAATIDGAIASLGKSYVITLQAVTCQEGKTLAREQAQAEDKEHVLSALSSAAAGIRHRLGESLSSIQQLNRPLEQATTSSLEALQDYSEGMTVIGQGHFLESAPLFERAIAIDPKFTMAYYLLAVVYENVGDMDRCVKYARQAYSLVDRVSERERTSINAYYYRTTGEMNKEVDAYQLAIRQYPDDWGYYNQLSVVYIDMGQFDEGLKAGQEALRLPHDSEAPYRRVLDAYICTDRLAEAHRTAEQARAEGIDGSRIHQRFLEMAYVEDDKAAMDRETQWFAGKPEEYLSFGLQAAYLNVHGQRHASHEMYRRAADLAQHEGYKYVADEFEEADARADALAGNCQTARRLGRPALALAMCGETAEAEKLAAEISKASPDGTIWNAIQLPEIQTMIALQHNDPSRGVELMSSASPYERAYPDAMYVRGMAYLKMHKGAEAAAEFEKITRHKGVNWAATWLHPNWGQYYAVSYLGAARGYELAGESGKAKKAYEDFFALWKDADRDIPIELQARAEYAKVR